MAKQLATFEKTLAYKFKNRDHLRQALVHRSYLNEHADFELGHNERLEFLGDAVLELIVTEHLYGHYENPEGELTNWRAALVNAGLLSEIAGKLEIDAYMFMSKGESKSKGKARQSILANAFEAVVGALYLDGGYAAAKTFIDTNVLTELPRILEQKLYMDAKSRFQEAAQEHTGVTPTYRVLKEEGPDHAKKFFIGIYIGDDKVAQGEGSSKQEAQMDAAEKALAAKDWH